MGWGDCDLIARRDMASQISAKVLGRKEFTTTAIVDHLSMANSSISG
jgi:hypothetical protein